MPQSQLDVALKQIADLQTNLEKASSELAEMHSADAISSSRKRPISPSAEEQPWVR